MYFDIKDVAYGCFLHIYSNKIKKIHHQCFLINYHVKPGILNETIHPKLNLTYVEPKFGMLD